MSLRTLSELPFTHLTSDLDAGILADLKLQTVPAQLAGFSEWFSDTTPPVSLGWSWFIHSQTKHLLPAPEAIRSNVMLIDARGYDLGKIASSFLFITWLTMQDWQRSVVDAIDIAS
jgi:hypothetical protein